MASTLNSTPAANSSGNPNNPSQNPGRSTLRSSANSKADGRRQSGSPGDAGQRYVRPLPTRHLPPLSALPSSPSASSTIILSEISFPGTKAHGVSCPPPRSSLLNEWTLRARAPRRRELSRIVGWHGIVCPREPIASVGSHGNHYLLL